MIPAVIQLNFSEHLLCSERQAVLALQEDVGGAPGKMTSRPRLGTEQMQGGRTDGPSPGQVPCQGDGQMGDLSLCSHPGAGLREQKALYEVSPWLQMALTPGRKYTPF